VKSTVLAASLVVAAAAAGLVSTAPNSGILGAPAAEAQNIGQRIVMGYVTDADTHPAPGATVFLKDLKTKSIRSYATAADGKFRFTQVNMAEDHELWAAKDGKKSAVKTVSSWDARKEYEVELKLK
jgi:hypothetical protein